MSDNMKEIQANELEQAAGGAGRQYIVYTVQKGDTLGKIARIYGVSIDDLVRWNNIPNPDLIVVGQRLKIYV